MRPYSRWVVMVIVSLLLTACAPRETGGAQAAGSKSELVSCPVTQPPDPAFIPPKPYPYSPPEGTFWFGSGALWTAVPADGVWAGLPKNRHGQDTFYAQKVFWWREGYSSMEEPEPALTVTGERLDGPVEELQASLATNAISEFGSTMLVGVDVPSAGCWKINGRYQDAELSFVVWIEP